MIDGHFHVELNGVKYRLAEDAEGRHYSLSGEALRPQNTVLVQGLDLQKQKFNMRQDIILWTITDWSGGEGQIKFDAFTPNRHWRLTGVDPFTSPGKLKPGPLMATTKDSGGSSDIAISGTLVKGAGDKLYLLDHNAHNTYLWDGTKWGAASAVGLGGNGACNTAAGDGNYIFWKDRANDNIYRYDGTTYTLHNNDTSVSNAKGQVYTVGDYIYLCKAGTAQIWEIPKSGTQPVASTLIDDPETAQDEKSTDGVATCVPGDNRLYSMITVDAGYTLVREIVPTTAAGTGYGYEIARIPGFLGETIWYHGGTLYMSGFEDGTNRQTRSILYLDPGGEYGSMGRIRQDDAVSGGSVHGGPNAQRMFDHGCMLPRMNATLTDPALMLLSTLTGGMCVYGYLDSYGATLNFPCITTHNGDYFMSTHDSAATKKVYKTDHTAYYDAGEFETPWHDFGMAEQKFINSVIINTETMPTDWQLDVSYAIDGSTSYTALGSHSSGTLTTIMASTDSATRTFSQLRIKVVFNYTGAGNPSTAPVLLGVDVRAGVAKKRRVWRLKLRCDDDRHEAAGQNLKGADKINNIQAAGDSDNLVVDFKDGYMNRLPGQYETMDVVVDEYDLDLSHPGEGTAMVTLAEVT